MVSSTLSSTPHPQTANPYIVVLDRSADTVRALLFDSEARRVEGYSAQLPRRAEAEADCLDELHRLTQAAEFRVAAIVGRAESDVTAEDRKYWPGFAAARWFPALPDGAGAILGCGCFGLTIGDTSLLGTVVESPATVDGLTSTQIDDKRWLLAGVVPEAGGAYAALKHQLKVKGSIEGYLETAAPDNPHMARIEAIGQRFREIFLALSGIAGAQEVIASGAVLLKSPAWTQRMANALGVPLTISTEPEPEAHGAAAWALERIGAIESLAALPASTAGIVRPEF